MTTQIVCPHCKTIIADTDIIADAVKGEGITTRSMMCECGERITYWQITAQLRDQKTVGYRFQSWVRALFNPK